MTSIPELNSAVQVVQLIDECGDVTLVGEIGFVVGYEAEVGGEDWDPLVIVRFGEEVKDGFWIEELKEVQAGVA